MNPHSVTVEIDKISRTSPHHDSTDIIEQLRAKEAKLILRRILITTRPNQHFI